MTAWVEPEWIPDIPENDRTPFHCYILWVADTRQYYIGHTVNAVSTRSFNVPTPTNLLPSVITSVVHDHAAPVAQYLGAIDTRTIRGHPPCTLGMRCLNARYALIECYFSRSLVKGCGERRAGLRISPAMGPQQGRWLLYPTILDQRFGVYQHLSATPRRIGYAGQEQTNIQCRTS